MKRRALLGLGAAFVGAGVVYESGAYDSVRGERRTTISSTNDANAFLGLEGYSDPGVVPSFSNRFANEVSITLDSSGPNVQFDVDHTGSFQAVPVTFSLQPGQTRQVQINAGATSADVDISLTELMNGTPTGSVTLTRTFAIPQAEQIEFSGDVKSAGSSGRFLFGLTNTGSIDATLIGVGVVQNTNPNVTKVGGRPGDSNFMWDDQNMQLVTEEMEVDSTTSSAEVYMFTQSITFTPEEDGGSELIFEFDRFRHSDNSNADMRGESVEVYLQFEDSSTTIELISDA